VEKPTIAFRVPRELLALLESEEGSTTSEKAVSVLRRALVPETPPAAPAPETESPEAASSLPPSDAAAGREDDAALDTKRREAFLSTLATVGLARAADPELLLAAYGEHVTIDEHGDAWLGDERLTAAAVASVIPRALQGTRGVGGAGSRAPNPAAAPKPTPPPGPLDGAGYFDAHGHFRIAAKPDTGGPGQRDRDLARMRGR
jgi:hypothetical protein